MALSSWYALTTFSSDSSNTGAVAWTSPSNASVSDDTGATVAYSDLIATPTSHYLKGLQAVGLSTLNWSAITQVDVLVRLKEVVGSGTPVTSTSRCSLVVGGTVQAENDTTPSGPYTSSFVDYTYNFVTNLPSVAQASASDFGVVFEFTEGGAGPRSGTTHCDVILVRFTYTRSVTPQDATQGSFSYRIHARLDNGYDQQEWIGEKITLAQTNSAGSFIVVDEIGGPLNIGSSNTVGKILLKNVTPLNNPLNTRDYAIWVGPYELVKTARIQRGEEMVFQLEPGVNVWIFSDYGEAVLKYWVIEK